MTEFTSNFLYIDYETNKNMDFYMVGFSEDGQRIEQVVLDPDLRGFAKNRKLAVTDPLSITKSLLARAKRLNATIVAFSEAEKNVFKQLNAEGELEEFREIKYLNLAKASKVWIRRCRSQEFRNLGSYLPNRKLKGMFRKVLDNSLPSRMRLLDFKPPSTHAPGLTTTRFNVVKSALVKRAQNYSALTPTQKRKGTCAAKHNEWDVGALPVLLNAVKREHAVALRGALTTCLA